MLHCLKSSISIYAPTLPTWSHVTSVVSLNLGRLSNVYLHSQIKINKLRQQGIWTHWRKSLRKKQTPEWETTPDKKEK